MKENPENRYKFTLWELAYSVIITGVIAFTTGYNVKGCNSSSTNKTEIKAPQTHTQQFNKRLTNKL